MIDYIELLDRNYNTRFLIPANLTAQQLVATTIQVQGWPRGWETVSTNQPTANQPKAVITKQSAKFWFPIANIDGNWTWGEGDDNDLEYEWSAESTANAKNSFSFSHYKGPGEVAQNGNFTAFLNAGQVNVWDETSDSGAVVEGAQITATRDGQSLLIKLKDPVYLAKLQKEMPSYLSFWSYGTEQDYWQNVKVEYVKEDVQLSLGNLTHTVDGTDKIPTVTTSPGNHTQDVTITYDGTTRPPSEVGSYTVVAYLNTANYKGRQVEVMTISTPPPPPPAPAPAPSGGAPSSGGGGPAQVQKSKKGGKSSAKKSNSGSSKKSAASKSSGSKKSGGTKKKK